ncbi:hypothetical protein J5N97_026353 [Dioscorea zingiberensis]|uniref:Disease resistance protein n=1 Tax=Dioscorea zingiberensis TaxID=325984 RepID=A0A9D5C2P0_9LILI|nr:hypothetical protein J5N97_026353 [Dioscorea zingiberensis]
MAESIVSLAVTKLGALIAQEIVYLREVGDQLHSLRDELQWMQAFLKDADDSIKGGNERAKLWVNQVRDVAYDAQDIIDTYIYKIHQQRRRPIGHLSSTLTKCITCTSQLTILHELGNQIANVKKRAEEISANKSKYGIESVGGTSSNISIITTTMSFNRKQYQLDVEEAVVVGFDKHVKTLVKLLITAENQGSHDQRRAVISIVGMGGLGKSTLAKKVCSNPDVKPHFTCQALVYVSQVFRAREILERIAKCAMAMSEEKMKELSQEKLKEKICEYLKGKRYLFVLDDVWTRDAWDVIKDVLPEEMNGSRVLLTTRNVEVGVHADRQSPLFKLQNLGEDESWDLFCKKAIHPTNSNCPSYLESIGKEMVAKCGGLPLAIVVLGGLVSRKEQTVEEWRKVLKSLKWQLQEGEDRITPILDLSYHHLPYYLKPCFLYFAVYPEDLFISADSIIRLWIAEGFVQPRDEETLEEVAEDYLQELVQRSLIKVVEKNSIGGWVFYQIHDLILDLSISQAKVENFLHVPKNSEEENILHKTRRLALNGQEMSSYIAARKYSTNSPTSSNMRTIICTDMEVRTSEMVGFLHIMKLLRVLNLRGTGIKKLPSDIGKLIHLRYLGLNRTEIKTLPSSIAELTNLQTLIMPKNENNVLPCGIWKMGSNIRHLLGHMISIKGAPSVDQSLPNLQTLSSVEVGPWLLSGLEKMTSLRKLSLLDVTDTYAEPLLDCLGKLDNLNHLSWSASLGNIVPSSLLSTSQSPHRRHLQLQEVSLFGRIERLPESNHMNACITRLTLRESRLEEDPLVTLGKLGNLQFLRLHFTAFVGEEMVCLERGFPQLKLLVLDGLHSLKRWNIEDQAMPKLRHMFLRDCYKLVMLPDGLERITSLQELTVSFMPPWFMQRLRVDEGEDWGKIRHIPSVTI